ncbi:MAG TPA: hypothetical protein VGN39_14770, partial [Terriglobales bacterium]|nr:hypothetical protein [Terriglobales bacterium]
MHLRITIGILLVAMSVPSLGAKADQDDEVSHLINRAQTAPIGQQPGLYTNIAERELKLADQLYSEDNVEKARAAVADVVTYSDKASEAAIQTGKDLKHTEIAMRKMSFKLRDMEHKLTFSD